MPAIDGLIDTLSSRQRELGLADRAFAARIGISRPMWVGMRNRRVVPGRRTLERILKAFPEFQLQVMASLFLASDSKNVESKSTLQPPPEPAEVRRA